jgi:hypothetical protein
VPVVQCRDERLGRTFHPSTLKPPKTKNPENCPRFARRISKKFTTVSRPKIQGPDNTFVWLAKRGDSGAALPKIAPTGFDLEGP